MGIQPCCLGTSYTLRAVPVVAEVLDTITVQIVAHLINDFPFLLVFRVSSVSLHWLSLAMGSHCPGLKGCQQFPLSWVSSASLNTPSCGQAGLMATDYCFLKFICVHSHFISVFPICPWVPWPITLNHQSGFPQLSILQV